MDGKRRKPHLLLLIQVFASEKKHLAFFSHTFLQKHLAFLPKREKRRKRVTNTKTEN